MDEKDVRDPASADPVPAPAHPLKRHEKLPWQQPKPAEEDPGARRRIEAIMKSPGYLQADEDVDFLGLDSTRGVRLMLDYQKPESLLEHHGIGHTIVVFGSTRIAEPEGARRRVEAMRRQQEAAPGDTEAQRRLRCAERVLANSRYYDMAREFGRLVGRSGGGPEDCRMVVMTGGGPGVMEAANRGAFDEGAKTVGLNIRLPHEQYPNPYVTPDLCFRFHYFAIRKLHFLLRAKALVAFPGGFGTFDELFESLTLVQTRTIRPIPIVLVGESYWRKAFDIDFLVDEGVIDREDRDLFWFAESAEEIWAGILSWHRDNGTPLFDE